MGRCQIRMVPEIIKLFRVRLPQMETRPEDPWLGNHLAKSPQVETPLKVLRIKMKRVPRSKIAKEKRIGTIKTPNLNSLTFINQVRAARKSWRDRVSKMILKMVLMIQKRLSIRRTKPDSIILKREHPISMMIFSRREAHNPSQTRIKSSTEMATWLDTKGIRVPTTTQIPTLITLQPPRVVKELRWVIPASSNQVAILASMDLIREEVAHQSQRRNLKTSPSRLSKTSTIITTFSTTLRLKSRILRCLEATSSKLSNTTVIRAAHNSLSNNWISRVSIPWTLLEELQSSRKTILSWVAISPTAWSKAKFSRQIWWVGDLTIRAIQTIRWSIVVRLLSKQMPVEPLAMLQSKMLSWESVEAWLD